MNRFGGIFEKYISYMKPVYRMNWYTAQNYVLLCYFFIKIQKYYQSGF